MNQPTRRQLKKTNVLRSIKYHCVLFFWCKVSMLYATFTRWQGSRSNLVQSTRLRTGSDAIFGPFSLFFISESRPRTFVSKVLSVRLDRRSFNSPISPADARECVSRCSFENRLNRTRPARRASRYFCSGDVYELITRPEGHDDVLLCAVVTMRARNVLFTSRHCGLRFSCTI